MIIKLRYIPSLKSLFLFHIRHRFFSCGLREFLVAPLILIQTILKANFFRYCGMFPSTLLYARIYTPTTLEVV